MIAIIFGISAEVAMRKYIRQIDRKQKEISMKKTLDFLIFLTELVSDSNVTDLLQEIMIYITSMKGKDWDQIYNATMKKIKPIQDQLNVVLNKIEELMRIQRIAKNIKLYSKLFTELLILLISTMAILIPLSMITSLLNFYFYAVLLAIGEFAIVLIILILLIINYNKLNINIIKENSKKNTTMIYRNNVSLIYY
ncbi:hypothetical protein MLJ63_11200 [Saccharolobus shibatae]|nr:hypothetical protein [Saccharolobus shibatae]MCH4816300.1 hypothetical protein [Saccharolobus shibatae]